MTEDEWLAGDDPTRMLDTLRGKAADRKLRLFAVACCRAVGGRLSSPLFQGVVGTAEAFADGAASRKQLTAARDSVWRGPPLWPSVWAAAHQTAFDAAWFAGQNTARISKKGHGVSPVSGQVAILRDIFGNPFRPVVFSPAWLTSTAVSLAEGIYAERAFDRLPILADALQDAGCEDERVLAHCRGDGPHVRGCWVVDAVLGRG